MFQFVPDISNRLPPLRGFLGETAQKKTSESARQFCGKAGRIGLSREHAGQDIRTGLAVKGRPPCKHFVQHTAERENITTMIDRFSTSLLRAHVCGRTEDGSRNRGAYKCWRIRQRGRLLFLKCFGKTEPLLFCLRLA